MLSDGIIGALPSNWKGYRMSKKGVGSNFVGLDKWFKGIHFDVLYSWMWHWTRKFYKDFNNYDRFSDSKLMVGVTGYKRIGSSTWSKLITSKDISGVNTWCKTMYDIVKEYRDDVWLTRHGIDTKIFQPSKEPNVPFRVGWCGNVTHSMKQCRILYDLDYPVMVHGRHTQHLEPTNIIIWERHHLPYSQMGEFYHLFHTYVCVSIAETGPLPVLEAAASGLPVVSTAVGIVPELLEDEWIIHDTNPEVVTREVNKKLSILANDPELRRKVGDRNRKEIMKDWTYEKTVGKWVEFFES